MSKYESMLRKLEEFTNMGAHYFSLSELFTWEQRITLPKKGFNYREKMMEFFEEQMIKHYSSNEAEELVRFFEDKNAEYDLYLALIRELKEKHERYKHIPSTLMSRKKSITAEANKAWEEANDKNDYNIFKPYLQQIFDLHKRIAKYGEKLNHPLDFFIKEYEKDLTTADIDELFADIKKEFIPLLAKIKKSDVNIHDSILGKKYDRNILRDECINILAKMGYDKETGIIEETRLPFCSLIGPKDIRIGLNFDTIKEGVFGSLHEMGHAIYCYSSDSSLMNCGLWGAILGGMDEAMAILYQNIIGGSEAFWKNNYNILNKINIDESEVCARIAYESFSAVIPSLIRVSADELTYSLHIIIRYEIEKGLLDGSIDAENLQRIWSDKYKEYLGVVPKTDVEGILQDVHWSIGLIGYFQSYALGHVYSSQIAAKLFEEVKDLDKMIEKGDYSVLNKWLEDRVFRHGKTFTPNELLIKITGEKANSKYFIDRIKRKYLELYKID